MSDAIDRGYFLQRVTDQVGQDRKWLEAMKRKLETKSTSYAGITTEYADEIDDIQGLAATHPDKISYSEKAPRFAAFRTAIDAIIAELENQGIA